ncbi:hypothetical protein [Stutzerimonas stutzeri]|uniref:hypothetical protein n=1 Tax=Stutzerimonas stutzeri TaxID=316 RepID=UPI003AF35452
MAAALDGQLDAAARPFAGVVQQIAQQLQHVFAITWQTATLRRMPAQLEVGAVDHCQGVEQHRQFGVAVEMRTGQDVHR